MSMAAAKRRPLRARMRLCLPALLACLAATGCAPLLQTILGVREVEPEAVARLVAGGPASVLVIDVRQPERFREGHVPGAVNLALGELDGYLARLGPPRATPVVTVCTSGKLSLAAASMVSSHGTLDVASLQGGMKRWQALGLAEATGAWVKPEAALLKPPVVTTTLWQQLVVVITAFGVKPLYMLASLVLIAWLWRAPARDLSLLRWSMVFFLLGELLCAANYLLADGLQDSLELGHGLGMMVANALLPWGLFVMLDSRVLRLTDPEAACVVQRLCGHCFKREAVACGVHRLFLLLAPALALLALLPWCAPLLPRNVILPIFGAPVRYTFSLPLQLAELRLYPALAASCLLVTFVLLLAGPRGVHRAQAPFFAGLGLASFPLFKLFLLASFRPMPVWSDAWEEVTELVAIAALAALLWVFRRQLGLPPRAPAGE